MKTGVATVPLDTGRCPKWLFDRMKRLSQGIFLAIREEFGPEEILKRLSDPTWFQSLGSVLAFDWNSSGLTTTTMGALKEAIRGLEKEIGIFICGGKGKTSKKTPEQIQQWGELLGFSKEKIDKIVYASKISAKIDSSLVQDGYQLYHHNLIFSEKGHWAVVQQGMSEKNSTARRYHWLSSGVKDFVEEPHSGIISNTQGKPLDLTARKSRENKKISKELVTEEPKTFLKDISLISEKGGYLINQKRLPGFTEMQLPNLEFHWHPVLQEKFDLKRLEKTILFAKSQTPENFENLLSLKGIGPRTIRALSLVAEIIYGAKPSYQDPARYSFAHGGKDGTPYFPKRQELDRTIEILEKGIKKSRISIREKTEAQKRLNNLNL